MSVDLMVNICTLEPKICVKSYGDVKVINTTSINWVLHKERPSKNASLHVG